MKRLSVPADNELYFEFDKTVPHGIKASLIRGLIRIAMKASPDTLWKIATSENKPELFELKEK